MRNAGNPEAITQSYEFIQVQHGGTNIPHASARIMMSAASFPDAITPAQSAVCTLEMLQALRELAVARGHDALAQLLAAAAAEARSIARDDEGAGL